MKKKVIAPVRNPNALVEFKEKIEIRKVDIYSVESVENALKGGDVVLSALGSGSLLAAIGATDIYSVSARNILIAMNNLKLDRVLLTTSVGVDFDPNFSFLYRLFMR